ncbi:hypothetical protein FQR65_LT07383 [Abscondita terminalis]|nr:hypothetical protein FQR65_LT07383 [Abscondita terminalis]
MAQMRNSVSTKTCQDENEPIAITTTSSASLVSRDLSKSTQLPDPSTSNIKFQNSDLSFPTNNLQTSASSSYITTTAFDLGEFSINNDETQEQQRHESPPTKSVNQEREAITGRRIVDVNKFFTEIIDFKHLNIFACQNTHLHITAEQQHGLESSFTIQCSMCYEKKKIFTDNTEKKMDINQTYHDTTIYNVLHDNYDDCNTPHNQDNTFNDFNHNDKTNYSNKAYHYNPNCALDNHFTTTSTPKTTDPEEGTWELKIPDTNNTCVILHFAMQLQIPYTHSINGSVNATVNIPKDAAVVSGDCTKPTDANIMLEWMNAENETDHLVFHFWKNETKYYLNNMELLIRPDSVNFPGSQTGNTTLGWLQLSHLQLQAFGNSSTHTFDSAEDCAPFDTPDIVPIAVGCALALLVIIVLIAYLVGRRRRQARGYLSM